MEQIVNEAYEELFVPPRKFRYAILMGGRGAGRSTTASQFVLAKLRDATSYFRCAIMRFILTDVRKSIYQEILDRIDEQEVREELGIVDGVMLIRSGKNTVQGMGFRKSSGDQKSKMKSLANFNCVVIEEADEIPEDDFMQLDDSLRTMKGDILIILLLNPPPRSHWIIKRFFDLLPTTDAKGFYVPKLKKECEEDTLFIRTDYRDNIENISEATRTNYERYKETKPAHFWNMIRGLVPEVVRGKIFHGWREIDEIPHEARFECSANDFGFDPDPAAGLDIYYYNGGYILDEVFYQTHLSNHQLAKHWLNRPNKGMVVCDNAEPKSIQELKDAGVDAVPCQKGADSVRAGNKKVQGMRISYTKRSTNLKREYENYRNKIDKNGDEVAAEDPACANHLMACARYGLNMLVPSDPLEERIKSSELHAKRRERVDNARQDAGLA